jgi:hypothetical protein
MCAAHEEAKIAELMAVLTDETGNLRPIERIEFEPIGSKIRYTLWSNGRRLQTVMAPAGDVVGLLKATQIFLAVATGDLAAMSTADEVAGGAGQAGKEKSFPSA